MKSLWGFATTPTPEVSVEAAMGEAIEPLTSLPGARTVLVVGGRGTVFYEWYRTSLDRRRTDLGGADVLALAGQARSLLSKARAGELEGILLRARDALVLVQAAGSGFLIVVADKSVNLAMLFLRARAAAERVSRMLR